MAKKQYVEVRGTKVVKVHPTKKAATESGRAARARGEADTFIHSTEDYKKFVDPSFDPARFTEPPQRTPWAHVGVDQALTNAPLPPTTLPPPREAHVIRAEQQAAARPAPAQPAPVSVHAPLERASQEAELASQRAAKEGTKQAHEKAMEAHQKAADAHHRAGDPLNKAARHDDRAQEHVSALRTAKPARLPAHEHDQYELRQNNLRAERKSAAELGRPEVVERLHAASVSLERAKVARLTGDVRGAEHHEREAEAHEQHAWQQGMRGGSFYLNESGQKVYGNRGPGR